MPASHLETFYSVVSAAISDMMEHGFDSQDRVDRWLKQIERVALIPD